MTTFRDIARDEIARLEHHYRTQSRGLWLTVEAEHVELLTHGPDVPEDATPGDRAEALARALDRVHEGKTRADGLRRVGRVLQLVLRAMGGEPIYDRDAVPETVRGARAALATDGQSQPQSWPRFLNACRGCGLAASKGQRTCTLGDACEGLASEREPVRLDRGEVEGAAERHGLLEEGGPNA